MTQHGVRSERQNGSDEVAAEREPRMTGRIDASLHAMEPPSRDPMIDRPPAEPHSQELPPRNDPVLPLGDLGDHMVEWQQLTPYFVDN
jgi:hypothetical protein